MENENNVKNILLISAMLIIIVLGGWIIYDKMINNGKGGIVKNNEVNKEKINEVVSQNKNYEFHDVKIYDEKTNGNIVYGNNYDFDRIIYNIFGISKAGDYYRIKVPFEGYESNAEVYVENGILYYAATYSNRGTTTTTRIDKVGKVKRFFKASDGGCTLENNKLFVLNENGDIYVISLYAGDQTILSAENLEIKKIESPDKFENISFMFPDHIGVTCSFGVIVGKTASNELRYYRTDGTVYDKKEEQALFLSYSLSNIVYVHDDATISFNGNDKISYQTTPVYYNEIYSIKVGDETNIDDNSFKFYLIDRQGYLYSMKVKNKKLENVTKSSKVVSKIGIEKKQITESEVKYNIMVIYENGSFEKINDIGSYEYDDKNFKKFSYLMR